MLEFLHPSADYGDAMKTWLSMDTAPLDGTTILLRSEYGLRSGRYKPSSAGDTDPWKYDAYDSDGCGCCYSGNSAPTGWMPLPEGSDEA